MRLPKNHCPRCNAFQKFGNKKRQINHDMFEIYIECSYCHWEEVVISDTSDMISLYNKIERLKVRAEKDPQLKKVLEHYRGLYLGKKQSNKETT